MAAVAKKNAVVVGSGPNGLAAAIELARHGVSVRVLEAAPTIGGGARTAQLTEPGFHHDICSAVHPLGVGSPFFRSLDLAPHGLQWLHPPTPLAHPLDDGSAVTLNRSVTDTAAGLDAADRRTYQAMMGRLLDRAEPIIRSISKPVPLPPHPLTMTIMGTYILRGAAGWLFRGERARALMSGLCAHSFTRLNRPPAWAMGLYLGLLGHAVGWPIPRGGAQRISDALARELASLGGHIETDHEVRSMRDLADADAVLFEVTPRQLLQIAADELPASYCRRLRRYRYGPGVFKIDWALDRPIPWRAEACHTAGTVHVGGTFEEVADAERQVIHGEHPQRPFVLLSEPTRFDPSRAPSGKHIAWAYCHVPNGSRRDMTAAIEQQVERFAPGFRHAILARSVMHTADMQQHNANYIGGDVNGGSAALSQLLFRPTWTPHPWTTPNPRIYLCSASTPPGGGIHGMCGHNAAQYALTRLKRRP